MPPATLLHFFICATSHYCGHSGSEGFRSPSATTCSGRSIGPTSIGASLPAYGRGTGDRKSAKYWNPYSQYEPRSFPAHQRIAAGADNSDIPRTIRALGELKRLRPLRYEPVIAVNVSTTIIIQNIQNAATKDMVASALHECDPHRLSR